MVRDRLAELCANKRNDCKSFLPEISQKLSNKKVKDVLDEAEKIRDMVRILQDNINIVKDLHNNVLSHTDLGIQNELESRTFIISQTAFRIRTSLKELGKDVSSVDELTLESARDGPVYMRIKFLQCATILRMFSDIMHAYNESLLRYHDKCSSLLHQQRILLRKETASQIFDQSDNDEEKTNLFVDNGEQLNCVEYFACKATDDVEGGRCDLTKAEKRRRRNRKRKTKLLIILGIIIIILLLIAIFL
ncbi:uncharacterized protein LOC123266210 isoform X2 [Cotesia glomerata]|uniref:uncharacterized protein LOC123266210 isoform X2 n=1 Tax=Cotesia glomerata TaxID=32391 RepID=UPI001D019528|nr:uncharacterized protein LOC123266210 isoform X2 [Cotesia glomerata]